MTNKTCDAIVLAAGASTRFKSSISKQFLKINNKSLIDIAIQNLSSIKKIRNIYIVLKKNNPYKIRKDLKIIIGGRTRTKSVFKSLSFVSKCSLSQLVVIFIYLGLYNLLVHLLDQIQSDLTIYSHNQKRLLSHLCHT